MYLCIDINRGKTFNKITNSDNSKINTGFAFILFKFNDHSAADIYLNIDLYVHTYLVAVVLKYILSKLPLRVFFIFTPCFAGTSKPVEYFQLNLPLYIIIYHADSYTIYMIFNFIHQYKI